MYLPQIAQAIWFLTALLVGCLFASLWNARQTAQRAQEAQTRLQAEVARCAESEERFRSAIHAMQEGFALQNEAAEIIICNRSAELILGMTAEQMMGRTSLDPRWRAIRENGSDFPGESHPAIVSLREGIEQNGVVMGICKPDGQLTWVSITSVPLFKGNALHPHAVVVTFSDITDRKWFEEQIETQILHVNEANLQLELQQAELAQANARLESLATTDGLTGLKNHRAFQEKLTDEYARAIRYGKPLSILLLDVDQFKKFNDTFGHPAGDQVLKKVATILQATARTTDFVARYGGEEFVVILPETAAQGALECGERIRAAIAEHLWEQRPITASIGVSALHITTANSAALFEAADKALYASKAAGRNCTTYYGVEAPQLPVDHSTSPGSRSGVTLSLS